MWNQFLFMLQSLKSHDMEAHSPLVSLRVPLQLSYPQRKRLTVLNTEHQVRMLNYTFWEVTVYINRSMVRMYKIWQIILYMILSFTATFKFTVQSNMQCKKCRSMSKFMTENNHKALSTRYHEKKMPPERSNTENI